MRLRGLMALALVLASACSLERRGPWVDANGRGLLGSEVIEFEGFEQCGQGSVVFLRFFGDQYAKDPEGDLGELVSTDGETLTFEVSDTLPEGAEPTGITQGGREIYVADDRASYLYVLLPDGDVERWPRAEVDCRRA